MTAYATRSQFYAYGLPAAALVAIPRNTSAVDPVANALTVEGHGLSDGAQVRFEAPGGVLPGGLSASVIYFVQVLGSDMLQVSLTDGGPVVDITDQGTPPIAVIRDPGADIDLAIELASREVDEVLTAHEVPLVAPYPVQVIGIVCRRAARHMLITYGLSNPQYADAAKSLLDDAEDRDTMSRWRDGKPIRGLVVDQTPDVPDNASTSWGDPSRGWEQTFGQTTTGRRFI